MENQERTCLLHWTTLLRRHTQKYIKPDMQDQHNRLYKQYKDSMTMDEVKSRYLAIRAWWLSSRAASEDAIRDLNLWLAFWHFRYRQWGGCMQMVRPSSLAYLVIQSHIRLHNWTLNCNLISPVLGLEFGRNGRHAVLQLIGDHPQQVAATIW
jgi:hypothetical protein